MEDSAIENVSRALYQYLCQNIVGTEDHVKTIRMMNTVRDDVHSNKNCTIITSGSFGEGLEMRDSDVDIMFVMKELMVSEDTPVYFNADTIYFTMDTDYIQPGYTKLRLEHGKVPCEACEKTGSNFYFSNLSFKRHFSSEIFSTLHGPCLSDKNGLCDLAYCLYSDLWITPAKQWIARSNNSWPRSDVKQAIVKHGVLFVPIGVKGSTQEELEWRISFSVGEKLLINTFTHTQLVCYALMKIILKDIIAVDIDCKELLCSYFMKTVLFWICEELPSSIWKPENLIFCYMRCFRRLIYCVEYKVCPHYFIPENNLFENKIQGHTQETLFNKLYILNSYGWEFILLSDQISCFNALAYDISKESSYFPVKYVEKVTSSAMFRADHVYPTLSLVFEKMTYKILSFKSSKIKYLYTYYMSKYCGQILPIEDMSSNKSKYKHNNTCISTLLLNTRHDAVSGWLMLASFFYKRKDYKTVIYIVQYSLLKCSPEKLQALMDISNIDYDLLHLDLFKKMTTVQLRRYLLLNFINFTDNSKLKLNLIPNEIDMGGKLLISPVAYAHFLLFLCHYHLNNSKKYLDSLMDLQLTLQGRYFIEGTDSACYYLLGVCFQMIEEIQKAKQAYKRSFEIYPNKKYNIAFQKLSLLS
ncbi:uncharacterized protein [Mytilus edulis]|uniref:uncharacterized protein n=1 Tax=Mytilus edulis TaxID=6550 RepID=UPI0039F148AC